VTGLNRQQTGYDRGEKTGLIHSPSRDRRTRPNQSRAATKSRR
jgi:hypothetical protein